MYTHIKITLLLTLYILCCPFTVYCQSVGINITGAKSDPSAILDVSSTSQGVLIPRMTISERNAITSPVESLLIYDTDTHCFEAYYNGAWVEFGCLGSSCPIPSQPGPISGSTTFCDEGNGYVYSISDVYGATSYSWSLPSGAFINNGQGTTSITVTFGSISGNISVSAGNSCGTSTSNTISVTMNSGLPTPGAITGNTCISRPAGNVYLIKSVSGATSYIWSLPAGDIITSGQGSTSVTVAFVSSGSGNISVIAKDGCESSAALTLAVKVCFTEYTTAGTYTWVCPAGVTIVNVVCAGGGGGGKYSTYMASDGGDSYFITVTTICGRGGKIGGIGTGGTYTGDGGGNGGNGSSSTISGSGGGGGAGGYNGNGGTGGRNGGNGTAGSGGAAGGGGSYCNMGDFGGGGGGIGIYGTGANGTGGVTGCNNNGGGGGSGGNNGSTYGAQYTIGGGGGGLGAITGGGGGGLSWKNAIPVIPGNSYTVVVGTYGSDGGYDSSVRGGKGAVFIMWCTGKTFPNN